MRAIVTSVAVGNAISVVAKCVADFCRSRGGAGGAGGGAAGGGGGGGGVYASQPLWPGPKILLCGTVMRNFTLVAVAVAVAESTGARLRANHRSGLILI